MNEKREACDEFEIWWDFEMLSLHTHFNYQNGVEAVATTQCVECAIKFNSQISSGKWQSLKWMTCNRPLSFPLSSLFSLYFSVCISLYVAPMWSLCRNQITTWQGHNKPHLTWRLTGPGEFLSLPVCVCSVCVCLHTRVLNYLRCQWQSLRRSRHELNNKS